MSGHVSDYFILSNGTDYDYYSAVYYCKETDVGPIEEDGLIFTRYKHPSFSQVWYSFSFQNGVNYFDPSSNLKIIWFYILSFRFNLLKMHSLSKDWISIFSQHLNLIIVLMKIQGAPKFIAQTIDILMSGCKINHAALRCFW